MQRLCKTCNSFRSWTIWTGQPLPATFNDARFAHYATGSQLKESAHRRCHLCLLLHQALMRSARPEGETDLPDRQIYIAIQLPRLRKSSISLKITVEPASLALAGDHDPKKWPDYSSFFKLPCEDLNTTLGIGHRLVDEGGFAEKPVWSIYRGKNGDGEEFLGYFFGHDEITEDHFYAIAKPYYVGFVDLGWMNGQDLSHYVLANVQDELDNSTRSRVSRVLILFWNRVCLEGHPYCIAARREAATSLLPKRVLYIETSWDGTDDPPSSLQVRLMEPGPGTRASYVTLSYCWGQNNAIRTLKENIENHKHNIPWNRLPRTAQDALTVTLSVGCRYLWIDSLCIVQDSKEDWETESGKMGSIYRESYFCISALASNDADGGCFRERDGLMNRPCELWPITPHALQFPGLENLEFPVYAYSKQLERQSGPPSARGWVLQEEVLSLRRVIFGEDAVSWKCLTTYLTEGSPDWLFGKPNTLRDGAFDPVQLFQAGLGGLLNLSVEKDLMKLYQCWMFIIEGYTQRRLTRGSDRLAALAGLATEFARATNDTYLAGMWTKFLWRDLLWHASSIGSPRFGRAWPAFDKMIKQGLVEDFTAPSWSWAKLNADIIYFPRNGIDDHADHQVLVQILGTGCEPLVPESITALFTGSIQLQGTIATATACQLSQSDTYDRLGQTFRTESSVIDNTVSEELDLNSHAQNILNRAFGNEQPPGKLNTFENKVSTVQEMGIAHSNSNPEQDREDAPDLEELPSFLEYQAALDNSALNTEKLFDEGFAKLPDTTRMVVNDEWPLHVNAYPGNALRDVTSGDQVGYWAPDLATNAVTAFPVLVLAISRHRGYVYGLGLEVVDEEQGVYERIGLAFWHEVAWDRHEEKTELTITVI